MKTCTKKQKKKTKNTQQKTNIRGRQKKKKCSNTKNKGENKNYSPEKSINDINTKNQRRRREKHIDQRQKNLLD